MTRIKLYRTYFGIATDPVAVGIVVGVLLLQIIFTGLNFLAVDANMLYIIKGLIILIACAIDNDIQCPDRYLYLAVKSPQLRSLLFRLLSIIMVFVLAGMMYAVTGFLDGARIASANANTGLNYECDAIAAEQRTGNQIPVTVRQAAQCLAVVCTSHQIHQDNTIHDKLCGQRHDKRMQLKLCHAETVHQTYDLLLNNAMYIIIVLAVIYVAIKVPAFLIQKQYLRICQQPSRQNNLLLITAGQRSDLRLC